MALNGIPHPHSAPHQQPETRDHNNFLNFFFQGFQQAAGRSVCVLGRNQELGDQQEAEI